MKAIVWAGMFLTALLLTACAGVDHKPVDAKKAAELAEARELVAALGAKNHTLWTFKGTGRFKVWQEGRVLSTRAAWVGTFPDKLRIAVMNPAGQPMVSLSTDGQYLYLISHADGEFYKKPSNNPTLQRLVSIPISANDIISILTARLPIREHHTAELTADESGRGYILTLSKKWRGVTEKIYLDTDKRSVLQIEIYGASDQLSYRTVFQGKQHVNEFELPAKIMVSDTEGNRFELEIDKYWTDVPLLPSIFVLAPP
ncbi:MAG: DUF4292 domain-containing protein [Desulfobacterales bacterium]|nr:DUF4292 domain-containing protein [Desulfobacterales bacterium]